MSAIFLVAQGITSVPVLPSITGVLVMPISGWIGYSDLRRDRRDALRWIDKLLLHRAAPAESA